MCVNINVIHMSTLTKLIESKTGAIIGSLKSAKKIEEDEIIIILNYFQLYFIKLFIFVSYSEQISE